VSFIETEVNLPHAYVNVTDFGYHIEALCLLVPKDFKLFAFPIYERTRRKLFQKCIFTH
jgi:hypothetical protein